MPQLVLVKKHDRDDQSGVGGGEQWNSSSTCPPSTPAWGSTFPTCEVCDLHRTTRNPLTASCGVKQCIRNTSTECWIAARCACCISRPASFPGMRTRPCGLIVFPARPIVSRFSFRLSRSWSSGPPSTACQTQQSNGATKRLELILRRRENRREGRPRKIT